MESSKGNNEELPLNNSGGSGGSGNAMGSSPDEINTSKKMN